MATITRTFGITLNSTYAPVSGVNPIVEVLQLQDMVFDADERLAIYLDTAQAIIDIGSFNIAKIPNLEGDESTIEEALALSKAESESNKIGLKILTRKNNTGNWAEIAEFILLNYGRKDYLDLRTKTGFPARLLERNDALAVQLVDYGDGLLWDVDVITVNFALSIEIEKKNNLEAIEARMAAFELALGRTWTDGNLPLEFPTSSLYGSIGIPGMKNNYAGLSFINASDIPVLMFSSLNKHHGIWSPSAIGGWHWLYDNGNFNIYSSSANTNGSFIGLYKGLNSLPGFPNDRYPTVRTDDANLYFSINGVYSAHINANGVYTAVSDRNKKENLQKTDDIEILKLLLNIPTYTYNFKNSDTRIRNLSCMAQDFYSAFGLGGDVEIDEDDSPTCPSKMLSASDAIGVCMAAIKGLAKQVANLKKP